MLERTLNAVYLESSEATIYFIALRALRGGIGARLDNILRMRLRMLSGGTSEWTLILALPCAINSGFLYTSNSMYSNGNIDGNGSARKRSIEWFPSVEMCFRLFPDRNVFNLKALLRGHYCSRCSGSLHFTRRGKLVSGCQFQ